MKFFKITLNTVGKDNEKVIFVIPPADEADENGNPAYDEDFLLNNIEYKNYLKYTKAAVVTVAYILYEGDDSTKLNYDELLNNEDKLFKIDQNDYLIEVKKAKPKPNNSSKISSTTLYIILGIIAAAIVALLIFGSSSKKGSGNPAQSDIGTGNVSSGETVKPELSTASETGEKIPTASEVETLTAAQTDTAISESSVTTAEEVTFTLTFDKNGGTGTLNNGKYAANTVVELPFTNLNRIGYTLMGWATAPTEPYTLYNNDTSRYVMPSAPVTLYAIWTADEFEVTYNYQINGSSVSSKEKGRYGEMIQLKDISGIDSGLGEFIGWGLLPNAVEPVSSLMMPDGGIELYAIYKRTN